MNKNATINEVDSTHANASVESNVVGKEKKTKFVVTCVECRSHENVESKRVYIVGIYDSIIRANDAMKEDMFDTMCDNCYGCYIEGVEDSNAMRLIWEDLEYLYDVKEVAA